MFKDYTGKTYYMYDSTFKDVRAQKLPIHRFFLKLWLTIENDKIRLKNVKKIGGHRTRF